MSVGAQRFALLDSRYGPILDVHRQRLGDRDPAWWLCTTSLARYPIGSPFNELPSSSAGTSLDPEQALRRAVGEALERYSALNAPISTAPATLHEAGLAGRLPRCAPDEPCASSFRAPPLDVLLTHAATQRLDTGERVLVPAALVDLTFAPRPPEPPVALPISTGLAFHPQLAEAIWRGLCEVVERDAVMTMWWLRAQVPRIDFGVGDVPACLLERLERLEAQGFEANLYDITTEVAIPTVFCVLRGARFPRLVVGAATRADPAEACAKALDEVVSMRVALHAPRAADGPETNEAPSRLEEHARLYADDRHHPAFEFLADSEGRVVPYSAFAERAIPAPCSLDALSEFAAALAQDDLTVLWADVTSPDVSEFGYVVRAVVPELVPLSPDDHIRWLATPRLLLRAGVDAPTRSAFNPDPHPFA